MSAAARAFRWYREPVAWLGAAVLATAIGGCISLIRTASRHVDAELPEPVAHRARMQVSAQRLSATLPSHARLARDGGRLVVQAQAAHQAPASLQLLFWTTRAEHDVTLQLQRQSDGSYAAPLPPLPPQDMHVRIDTPQRDDALVGEWPLGATLAELREPRR
jgi:branched-subunit amino acid aminotransferase/4-amino-4-deoxychorismate lyase